MKIMINNFWEGDVSYVEFSNLNDSSTPEEIYKAVSDYIMEEVAYLPESDWGEEREEYSESSDMIQV